MAECPYFEHLLVLPHLRVQNANAISSPLTHGSPSTTAFLGLMWALERKAHTDGLGLQFNAIGAVIHDHQEQITDDGFIQAFRLTRNPIDKDGSTAAIVEEGRIHLDITLIFAVQSAALQNSSVATAIARQVLDLLGEMRIASGTLIPSSAPSWKQTPYVVSLPSDRQERQQLFNQFKMRLLPGFVLVERSDLLEQRHQTLLETNPSSTRLDAWLSLSRINWRWQDESIDPETKAQWRHDRQSLGWIVPIPLGYGALTELLPAGSVANARDRATPFRFVESLYGIGQWLSPHRLHALQQLFWYTDSQPQDGLYRCRNDYQPEPLYDFD